MKWHIVGGDAFPMIEMHLEAGEAIKAESGAMVTMRGGLTLKGKMDGGFGKAMARMFTGESFFLQTIEADKGPGVVHLATPVPGGMVDVEIQEGQELIVQKNGYLASTQGVDVSSKVQSITKGLFSGEGFFIVKLKGSGTAFLSSYGSIHAIDIPKGEDVLIDNGHIVAWDGHMKYDITKGASSWFSAATSGEGLGCRFHGPGRVYVQTRNPYGFGVWAFPYLPIPRQHG
ncbi:MAG: TIGR00266 family protein [Alphaproteobacteria bacterium]|nr:TIGR00266 family protein [Alphaproteobacteria bacterium]